MDDQGLYTGKGKEFSCSPKRPEPLWGPPSLLFSGYRSYLPGEAGGRGESGRSVKLTTHLHLASRLGMSGAIFVFFCAFIATLSNIRKLYDQKLKGILGCRVL